jgi:hypothetical protein
MFHRRRHSLFPPSSTHRPIGLPCGSLSRVAVTTGRPMGLPRSVQVPAQVRFRLSAGGSTSAMGESRAPIPDLLPFGPSLVSPCGANQHLWLVLIDDVYQRFTYVNHAALSEPPTALVLAVAASSHDSAAIPVGMRDTLVPGASHPTVASDACPGRIPVAENRVESCNIAVSSNDVAVSTATCTTSCRTLTNQLIGRRPHLPA